MDKITIAGILIYILKCIYTTLPAMFANFAPIIVQKVNFLVYPLDFNKTIGGTPILGKNKTFRGLFFGILSSIIIMNVEYGIYKLSGWDFTIYSFDTVNFQALGFLMGFGVIAGDSVKSFIKRRLAIEPGKSFIPWDQIDCVLGGLLFGRIVWDFPIMYGISIIIITFCMHIGIRYIAYYLGITKSKW